MHMGHFLHYNHGQNEFLKKTVIISKLSVQITYKYIFLKCASQKVQFDMPFMKMGSCWKFDPTWPFYDLLIISP